MTSNKNQHFVPRCYLRPFTLDCANLAINLFNIDRLKFIEGAPVKNQCSGDYFYGKDLALEKALEFTERAYSVTLRNILTPGFRMTDSDRSFLRRFWLLQHMRTEAASRRAEEMTAAMVDIAGIDANDFRLGIRDAVQTAMHVFVEQMDVVDDLKICLLRNRTSIPFVTSDDPAILTNRWHLEDKRVRGKSFGLQSAGNLLLLPLSPRVLCLGYDGDVYSVPHKSGWVDVRHAMDVQALNEHQYLNCRANIFVQDSEYARGVHDAFCRVAPFRPSAKHVIHYAVLERREGDFTQYRVIDPALAGDHQEALIHTQAVHARPSAWPRQIRWRTKGVVFTNGTAMGYIRRARAKLYQNQGFRKELARKTK